MSAPRLAVIVPSAPGLLECAGATDPFAAVREEAVAALRSALAGEPRVAIVGAGLSAQDRDRGVAVPLARRVGCSLLAAAGFAGEIDDAAPAWVVVADGSARRSERAPGHRHPRAHAFDEEVGEALWTGSPAALAALDQGLAAEVWAAGAPTLARLGRAWAGSVAVERWWVGAPLGVAYWVVVWRAPVVGEAPPASVEPPTESSAGPA